MPSSAGVLGPAAGFAVLGVNLFNMILAAAVLGLGVADYLGGGLKPGVSPLGRGTLAARAIGTGSASSTSVPARR